MISSTKVSPTTSRPTTPLDLWVLSEVAAVEDEDGQDAGHGRVANGVEDAEAQLVRGDVGFVRRLWTEVHVLQVGEHVVEALGHALQNRVLRLQGEVVDVA